MLTLDTDHISHLQYRTPASAKLRQQVLASNETIVTSAITLEEQTKGWIALLSRESDVTRQVAVYASLVAMFEFFADWNVVHFSDAVADEFLRLRQQRVRIGTCGQKIAAIAITEDARLLTANTRDFEQVPNLRFENWLGG